MCLMENAIGMDNEDAMRQHFKNSIYRCGEIDLNETLTKRNKSMFIIRKLKCF